MLTNKPYCKVLPWNYILFSSY